MIDGPRSLRRPHVAVILPAHNEEGALRDVIREIVQAVTTAEADPRIIVVDDGSTDRTAATVLDLMRSTSCIELIRLSRNFGHQAALLAGLENADADAVIMMDSDGQHPPELIPRLIEAWRSGSDVVNTSRISTTGAGLLKRVSSTAFYRLFRPLTGVTITAGSADFRLLDRAAVAALLQTTGSRPFFRGQMSHIGFRQTVVSYSAEARRAGSASIGLKAMLRLFVDAVLGQSTRVLSMIAAVGFLASVLSLGASTYAVAVRLLTERAVPGWASVVSVISLQFALLFLLLGAITTVLRTLVDEAIGRPAYVIAVHHDGRGERNRALPTEEAEKPGGPSREPDGRDGRI